MQSLVLFWYFYIIQTIISYDYLKEYKQWEL